VRILPDAVLATTIASTRGPVHVAASANGVVAAAVLTMRDSFSESLERRLGRPVHWVDAPKDANDAPAVAALVHLRAAADRIRADPGASGADDPSDVPLDIEDRPAWDRQVLAAVRAIPRGEVRSYGDVARAIGRPGAARAVGGAVGRNPVALLIPCHRVVAGDGTLGGYGGGWWGDHDRLLDLKAELLAGEGVTLPRSRSRR